MNYFENKSENLNEADQQRKFVENTSDYAKELVKEQFNQIEQILDKDQSKKFLRQYAEYLEKKSAKLIEIQRVRDDIHNLEIQIKKLDQTQNLQNQVNEKVIRRQQLQQQISKLKDTQSYYNREIFCDQQQLLKQIQN